MANTAPRRWALMHLLGGWQLLHHSGPVEAGLALPGGQQDPAHNRHLVGAEGNQDALCVERHQPWVAVSHCRRGRHRGQQAELCAALGHLGLEVGELRLKRRQQLGAVAQAAQKAQLGRQRPCKSRDRRTGS
eukprot:scaffold2699_cov98-Isochrysis_galbana.AAC.2